MRAADYSYPVTPIPSWVNTDIIGPQPITGNGLDGDWYVATNGSDSGTGSINDPFKTVEKAASVAQPGDKIYIRGGTYPGVRISYVSGTASQPITFSAFPGEQVILDGYLGEYSNFILFIDKVAHYLIFDGIEIADSSPEIDQARSLNLEDPDDVEEFLDVWASQMSSFNSAVRTNPDEEGDISNIVFRNMKIYHVGAMGFMLAERSHNITIENTLIEGIGYPRSGYGVYYHNENFIFRNNIVNGATYGLHLYTGYETGRRLDDSVIENNVFMNIGVDASGNSKKHYHLGPPPSIKPGGRAIFLDDPGDHATVLNNYVENASICLNTRITFTYIVHNMLVDCNTGIRIDVEDVYLINNVVTDSILGNEPPESETDTSDEMKDLVARHSSYTTDMHGAARANPTNAGPIDLSAVDTTPPAAVTDLDTSTVTATAIKLEWTAPGDDGSTGTADSYDIRYSTSPITASNFSSATQVPNAPAPAPSGTPQSVVVGGLSPSTTYYFALKSIDESNNVSGLSNVVSETTAAPPAGDLVAWIEMEDGSGTTASDSSGNGNDGTISGAAWSAGKVGLALHFDGTSDYVNLGNLDVTGSELTIAAWIKIDAFTGTSNDGRIVSKATSGSEADHYWMLSTINDGDTGNKNRLRFRLKTGGTTTTLKASSGDLTTGTWYHAAAVYDGSAMRLYLNGTEVGSTSKTGTITAGPSVPVWIGGNPDGASSRPLYGLIDDVRIYDRRSRRRRSPSSWRGRAPT